MKNYKKTLLGLALIAGMASLASCSDDAINDSTSYADEALTPQTNVVAVDSGTVTWHEHYTKMLAAVKADIEGANAGEVDSADLEMKAFLEKRLQKTDSIDQAEAGANGMDYGKEHNTVGLLPFSHYKWVRLQYQSLDKDKNPITLSTLLAFPERWFVTETPQNLVIGCHITITQDKQRPSYYETIGSDVGLLVMHASSEENDVCYNNLVVMPDYEGYGETVDRAHPYLYQEVTARQVVDGAKAAVEWFEKNKMKMGAGWGTMSVGYSQGGSVSMAVHRYIEQNGLAGTFNFKGSICGDGPYDPVATLKDYIKENKVFMPVAVGLIIKGMCDANPIITKAGYQPKDFFSEKFMATGIIDMIAGKQLNTDQIQEKLAEASMNGTGCTAYLKGREGGFLLWGGTWDYRPYTKENKKKYSWEKISANEAIYYNTTDLIRPEILAYINDSKEGRTAEGDAKGKALMEALEMNNLTTGWNPAHPMVVFHSTKDEVVKYVNFESADKGFANCQWFKGIQYDCEGTYTHVGTGRSFFTKYEGTYTRWIFNPKTDWNSIPRIQVEKGTSVVGKGA